METLKPGKSVRFQGLQGAAHLNGKVGTLVKFHATEQRWVVLTAAAGDNNIEVKAKPENLALITKRDLLDEKVLMEVCKAKAAEAVGGNRALAARESAITGKPMREIVARQRNENNNNDGDDSAAVVEQVPMTKLHLHAVKKKDDGFAAAVADLLYDMKTQFKPQESIDGVWFKNRYVGLGIAVTGDKKKEEGDLLHELLAEEVRTLGEMKVVNQADILTHSPCDAAILLRDVNANDDVISCIKQSLLPGGTIWMIIRNGSDKYYNDLFQEFPDSIWNQSRAVMERKNHSSRSSKSFYRVMKIPKRQCLINARSCPWMHKERSPNRQLVSLYNKTENLCPMNGTEKNYLQYELALASMVTIVPCVAERRYAAVNSSLNNHGFGTVFTPKNTNRAQTTLARYGMVIIKGLLSPSLTVPWGNAALSDLNSLMERLTCHPTRPSADLLNSNGSTGKAGETAEVFEAIDFKEISTRDGCRFILRSGPEMEKLRVVENDLAMRYMATSTPSSTEEAAIAIKEIGVNDRPSTIYPDVLTGSLDSWRFHPSLQGVITTAFNMLNPNDPYLFKGNFATRSKYGQGYRRQPHRLSQVGAIINGPGSADEAFHADIAHLYEHEDLLPCHYLTVYTPGSSEKNVENEFIDGMWTGNSTLGGTALVYGSHKLSVSTQLFSEGDEDDVIAGKKKKGAKNRKKRGGDSGADTDSTTMREQMLWLRTIRPSLEVGDVLIFDGRMIHFEMANTSAGDGSDSNAGRKPMLFLKAMQSWYRDPENNGDDLQNV